MFEVVKTAQGYASTPTILASVNGLPMGTLLADSHGDLFGTTTSGGAYGPGTVFEIVKTISGYASTPTTLVSFNGTDGACADGGVIADSHGDLFGTTALGGAYGDGTVFEIAKTAQGFASIPTVLFSFNGTDGSTPYSGLVMDAKGDLFGTTGSGAQGNNGTVFEIVKTAHGYANTPTTLVNFNGSNGSGPWGDLIIDSKGDLFGTTQGGGAHGVGTVFEVVKTAHGYASTPTTLVTFDSTNGGDPWGGLIANGTA